MLEAGKGNKQVGAPNLCLLKAGELHEFQIHMVDILLEVRFQIKAEVFQDACRARNFEKAKEDQERYLERRKEDQGAALD